MKKRILTTAIVALLIAITMAGLRHIDVLNDGIKLKQIEIKDNSSQLRLLDSKYQKLNDDLLKKDADKAELEKRLQDLQKEREKLQADLQAKREQKAKDIAVKAQQALTAPVRTQTAYASGGSCAEWMAQAGIPATTATNKLILKESNCRPHAVNPTSGACGIAQAYPCAKMKCPLNDSGAVCQLQWMNTYIVSRYGSWDNALSAWYSRCGSPQGCWY